MQIPGLLIFDGVDGFGRMSPGARILQNTLQEKLRLVIKAASLCIPVFSCQKEVSLIG